MLNEQELLAQVASMYYEDEMTQNNIAQALGVSRVKVYRLLKQAREERVVEITINWPLNRDAGLEAELRDGFDLSEALVLKSIPGEGGLPLSRLGQLGARYLEGVLTDGMTLAVCLGRSTYEVINAIRPGFQARVHVAQAMGSMPFAMQALDSATLARQLAQKLGGDVLYLSSPLMADSPEAAVVLRAQSGIQQALDAARAADVALLGIGDLDPDSSGFVQGGFISADELRDLSAVGAVGDMAGQIYGLDGTIHACSYNHRAIGLDFDDLQQIPITMAVAMGQSKAKAILGGLRTGRISVLSTDEQAAREVLRLRGK